MSSAQMGGAAAPGGEPEVARPGRRRPPRAPGAVSGGLVLVLVLILASVALTTQPESPPSIAELAPQAVTQIEEALADQAGTQARQGGTDGQGPGATATTTSEDAGLPGAPTTSTTLPIEVPRVRRCIGDPPRQTEDPQSPPCVPYFDGDNGGATTKGVTRDEIRVAYPVLPFEDASLAFDLADFFNRRYELYGRKIRLEIINARGGGFAQPNPPDMRADAQTVADEIDAFASLAYVDRKGAEHHYYDALADFGVISSTYRQQQLTTEARYARFAPYQWSWLPPTDQVMRLIGGFACRSLAGRPPRFADAPTNGASERSFGLLYQRTPDGSIPETGELLSTLRGCGVDPVVVEDQAGSSSNPQQAMLRLSQSTTSVICLCEAGALRDSYMTAATSQGFFPEWIVSGLIDLDLDNSYHGAPPDQASNVLGLSFRDPVLPRQEMPWYWAIKEVAPFKDPTGGVTYSAMARYEQLAQLAAGIQLAGPNLTPETLESGLHRARFPNPGAGQPPYYQARVGFPGGRHTMTDDATLFWYDPSEPGTVDPAFPGAICYLRSGIRYTASTFPTSDAGFFQAPCK